MAEEKDEKVSWPAHPANGDCAGLHGKLEKCEAPAPAQTRFIGGKLEVIADPETGAVSVSAPENIVVAMGLLGLAQIALHNRQNQEQFRRAAPSAIIPADASTLRAHEKAAAGLVRP